MKYKYLLGALAFSFYAKAASALPAPSLLLPPPTPATVTATMGSGTAVDIKWSSASVGTVGVRNYEIRKNSTLIATVNGLTLTFRDTNASINTDIYQVRACINACSAWKDATRVFDSGLWRLMSRQDRSTLTRDSQTTTLRGDVYFGATHQQWRIIPESSTSSKVKIKNESTQQCLALVNGSVSLAGCNTVVAGTITSFTIDTVRTRSEAKPGIYRIRIDSLACILPNATSLPFVSICNDSARWYIEPVGYGERPLAAINKYSAKGLLIVKPVTQVNDPQHGVNTQASIAQSIVDAAQVSFKTGVKFWLERITDGQVTWTGASVVANEPIRSLYYDTTAKETSGSTRYKNPITGETFFWNKLTTRFELAGPNFDPSQYGETNFLPTAASIPNDVQRFVPRGVYDTVQVFFAGGSVPGGWGYGPGRSAQSNHTFWTTINGGTTPANQWLSLTKSDPTEVFIHEMMHGFDSHYEQLGVPIEEGGIHAGSGNQYGGLGELGWIHFYRDIWLGTVIGSDDNYRGYGSRMFKLEKVSSFAARQPISTLKITQNTSGKCLSTKNGVVNPVAGTEVVFSSVCNTNASSFLIRPNGVLEFKGASASGSGFCVHPAGGVAYPGAILVLWPACTDSVLPIQLTDQGSIQNTSSGLCIHPNGGAVIPAEGTNALYWSGCDYDIVRFKFNRF